MEGLVANGLEAVLEVQLIGRHGQIEVVPTVVDTGFTSDLTLPPSAMRDMNFLQLTTTRVTLADGSTVEAPVFEGLVKWFGQEKVIRVLQTDSEALLGMGLMQDCRLTMDIVPDGKFTINPLGNIQGVSTNA